MNNKVKNLIIFGTITVVGTVALTSLSKREGVEFRTFNSQAVMNRLNRGVKEGDRKEFEPYRHLLYVKVTDEESFSDALFNEKIDIPDGYELYTIENYGEEAKKNGFDVWFTNTEKVEAEAVYNENTKRYEYSKFGKIVQDENIRTNPFSLSN